MTDRLNKMFERHYHDSVQHTMRATYNDPRGLMDQKTIAHYDQWTAESIQRMTEEIELLKEYRQALAERYNELQTAATVPVIRLRRFKGWSTDNKVNYYLDEITRYLEQPNRRDNTTYTDYVTATTRYPGTARRDAIKAFEAYKKNHPGIIAILDIEKGSWER